MRTDVERARRSIRVLEPSIVEPAEPAGPLDVRERAHWNLRIVETALTNAAPREVAPLSRQHQALVAFIVKVEASGPASSKLDELAAARRRRRGL